MAAAYEVSPKVQDATKIYKPENLLKTEPSTEALSERCQNKPFCECKRVMAEYEDLFNPDLNSQLLTNKKMDMMIKKYQDTRAFGTNCSGLDEQSELCCTCERF